MAKACSYRTWAIEAELREVTVACRRRKANLELDTASSVVAQWRSTHGSALPESGQRPSTGGTCGDVGHGIVSTRSLAADLSHGISSACSLAFE